MPRAKKKASVLLVVLVTLLFTAFALIAFIEKAGNDLLVEARVASANRLRTDAYSALEVTLGVLSEFSQADGGLHSPAEGWNDPLGFAGYEPASGRTIEVSLQDESGKLSLPHATDAELTDLFESWGFVQSDAEELSDALLTWMKSDHVASTAAGTTDYDDSPIPYAAPQRSLRSFDELAAIDFVRDKFYDENGRPNDFWRRFADTFSLYNYNQSNLNSATPDTLAALGQTDPAVQQQLSDYLNGTGNYKQQGPGYFKSANDVASVLGAQALPQGVGTQILALRVIITVHDANTLFRLNAVVTPSSGGARTVASTEQSSASNTTTTASSSSAAGPSTVTNNPAAASQATTPQLNYPFTLLEIHEEIIENAASPPPATNTSPNA